MAHCRYSHISNTYGLAISLDYRSGEGGGLLLAQIVTTCLRSCYRRGGGDITSPCVIHTARIPSPLPLHVAKTGRNHLNEGFTPLLPTGIGERF
jgi:hypothetical protein